MLHWLRRNSPGAGWSSSSGLGTKTGCRLRGAHPVLVLSRGARKFRGDRGSAFRVGRLGCVAQVAPRVRERTLARAPAVTDRHEDVVELHGPGVDAVRDDLAAAGAAGRQVGEQPRP